MQNFYLVWNPGNLQAPKVRHQSEQEARAEAERLARLNPGQKFYVLQTVAFCAKVDVRWSDENSGDEIPF